MQLAVRRVPELAQLARHDGRLLDARAMLDASISEQTLQNRYTWPQLWLAMRVEADLAEQARSGRTEVDADHRAQVAAIAARAAAVSADVPELRGYVAMTLAEQRRAADEPSVAEWSAAVEAWREAEEAPRLAYALFRLAEAQVRSGDRV